MSLANNNSKNYVDVLHSTIERLDRTGDFNSPKIANLRDLLVQRIAAQEGSSRENVLVSGTLKRSGAVASCIVRAVRVTLPQLNVTEYVRADVALAPPHLPNGEYELHFDGCMIRVQNECCGHWSRENSRAAILD